MTVENNGSQPQAGGTDPVEPQAGTPSADPQAGESANNEPQNERPQLTHEQALAELTRVRKEAAQYRTKANALEAEKQEAERAKLSKEEQLAARIADMEREKAEREVQHQQFVITSEVEKEAHKLGIVDPDAAAKLIDLSELEFDENGKPKNTAKLLRNLMQAKPYLAGQPQVSPTNPNLNHSQSGVFTESQLADFGFYMKNKAAITQAMREGKIIKG